MEHSLLRLLHFLGGILWMGGTVALTFTAALGASKPATAAARTVNLRIATPGMILAFVGGLGILLPTFRENYAHQPWMHVKLTLVLVGSALSGIISGTLRRASTQDEQPVKKLKNLAIAMSVILVSILCMVVLRPGTRP